jgi:hypothetical protein
MGAAEVDNAGFSGSGNVIARTESNDKVAVYGYRRISGDATGEYVDDRTVTEQCLNGTNL